MPLGEELSRNPLSPQVLTLHLLQGDLLMLSLKATECHLDCVGNWRQTERMQRHAWADHVDINRCVFEMN